MSKRLTTLDAHSHLTVLFQAEDAMRRRCAAVAARLELASSALVLLEIVCHADAALDDLDGLAMARGIVLETMTSRLRTWLAAVVGWVGGLWPTAATHGYSAVLLEMRRNVAIGSAMRRSALSAGDKRMADWCAMWTEQRTRLAHRLAATLAEAPAAERPAPGPEPRTPAGAHGRGRGGERPKSYVI
jgi:hypothetical protein